MWGTLHGLRLSRVILRTEAEIHTTDTSNLNRLTDLTWNSSRLNRFQDKTTYRSQTGTTSLVTNKASPHPHPQKTKFKKNKKQKTASTESIQPLWIFFFSCFTHKWMAPGLYLSPQWFFIIHQLLKLIGALRNQGVTSYFRLNIPGCKSNGCFPAKTASGKQRIL